MIINGIDPLQPYFVLNTRLYWKMRLVNSPVAHFYQFTCTEKNPVINGVVPDGAVDVIVDTDTGWSSVSGSVKSVIEAPFEQGHTYFGARFKPGAFEHYGGISASELIGTSVPLSDIMSCEILGASVSCSSFEQRVDVFSNSIVSFLNNAEIAVSSKLVQGILAKIYERSGDVTVNELEETFFYSRRHLFRVFKQYTGMDIKSFCKIVRFQSVLSVLHSASDLLLTDIAQNYGYYDQTHFQKEFKKYASLTPKVYINILKKSEYRSRITEVDFEKIRKFGGHESP